jgi:hypothetical protein
MRAMGRLIDWIADLPIRRIEFTTPTDEREASVGHRIAEAAEWIESAEETSAGSALGKRSIPFSVFSDSSLARWPDERLAAEPVIASNPRRAVWTSKPCTTQNVRNAPSSSLRAKQPPLGREPCEG